MSADETVSVRADDVRAVLAKWGEPSDMEMVGVRHRLAVAVTPPPPAYEPSEQDITDYCEAMMSSGASTNRSNRNVASANIKNARARGWDAIPRRLPDDG